MSLLEHQGARPTRPSCSPEHHRGARPPRPSSPLNHDEARADRGFRPLNHAEPRPSWLRCGSNHSRSRAGLTSPWFGPPPIRVKLARREPGGLDARVGPTPPWFGQPRGRSKQAAQSPGSPPDAGRRRLIPRTRGEDHARERARTISTKKWVRRTGRQVYNVYILSRTVSTMRKASNFRDLIVAVLGCAFTGGGCQLIAGVQDAVLDPSLCEGDAGHAVKCPNDGGGTGGSQGCNDTSDCPDPMNDCKTRLCTSHQCGIADAPNGASCSNNGGKVCSDKGECVECDVATDCAGSICQENKCIASSCIDKTKNGDEADIDCGGSCSPCPDGKTCTNGATDCTGGACDKGTCCTPKTCAMLGLTCGTAPDGCGGMLQCDNGVMDGTETDADCGGVGCAQCASGLMCKISMDCTSSSCVDGVCCNTSCANTCYGCDVPGNKGTWVQIPLCVASAVACSWRWQRGSACRGSAAAGD
jgi:hypothetical protein